MTKYKSILITALALLSVAVIQAQTNFDKLDMTVYNDSVRTETWTVYAGVGVCGYHGLRDVDGGTQGYVRPDFYAGVKYNIQPWIRVGFNAGYTRVIYKNSTGYSTTTKGKLKFDGYNYDLTTSEAVGLMEVKQHLAYGDLNVDFNISDLLKKYHKISPIWNLWAGTGLGYIHAWNKATDMCVVSQEGISQDDTHFNVYNHDYIASGSDFCHQNLFYLPVRLSLEYDITPRWTAGVKGEYKYLPFQKELTPIGIWSAGVTLAYNLTQYGSRKNLVNRYEDEIASLNQQINDLRKESEDCDRTRSAQRKEIERLTDILAHSRPITPDTVGMAPIFYALNKSKIKPSQTGNLLTVVNVLNANPGSKIFIQGYASPEGPEKRNKTLSTDRAEAIKQVLVNKYGISEDRISTESCGVTDKLYPILELNRVAIIYIEK